jgi:predicted phosphodiesterase
VKRLAMLVRVLLAVLVIGAGTIAGMLLALQVGSEQRLTTTDGTIQSDVRADLDGHLVVYVPLIDWRVRLLDHDAPVTITLEVRSIDREEAREGVSSASAAARSLQDVREDTREVVRATIRRAVLVASIGGVVGSLLAGGLLAGLLLRRRWLLVAPVVGVLVTGGIIAASLPRLEGIERQPLELVGAGPHADELPAVLRFAGQLLDVGDEYQEHFRTALASIGNVTSFAARSRAPRTHRALLMSDLHDNVFALDALEHYIDDDTTVFGAGDFVQVGARIEQQTATRVAHLGGEVVAVSGNHDTPQYMDALREAGATGLDATRVETEVDGLRVAGYPDPLERDEQSRGEHRLRVYGDAYDRQKDDVIEWWDSLDRRPDVVLIHQHGFAHHLAKVLAKRGDTKPLVILTGHDHELHVHATGPHVIVDGGTVGAGGVVAVGEQDASFAWLSVNGTRLVEVTLVSIEPLTGRARSERVAIHANEPRG